LEFINPGIGPSVTCDTGSLLAGGEEEDEINLIKDDGHMFIKVDSRKAMHG